MDLKYYGVLIHKENNFQLFRYNNVLLKVEIFNEFNHKIEVWNKDYTKLIWEIFDSKSNIKNDGSNYYTFSRKVNLAKNSYIIYLDGDKQILTNFEFNPNVKFIPKKLNSSLMIEY